jgi:hypothetical protein
MSAPVSAPVSGSVSGSVREAAGVRTVTAAERPDLAAGVPELLASRWPVFMLAGRPGHDADLPSLLMSHLEYQILLIDDRDELLGVGVSLPLVWDGTVEGLPAGWDGAVTASADLHERGGTPNAVCALSITTVPSAKGSDSKGSDSKGSDYAAVIMAGLKQAAAAAGLAEVIVPVRPVLKTRYPLVPMVDFLAWQTDDGRVFDPWLRLHLSMGATVLGIAPEAMTITGTVAEWQGWTGLALPGNGEYVIPGALAPLVIDREADAGVYREPNVWLAHPTDSRPHFG